MHKFFYEERDDHIKIKNIFVDKKDESSKTIYCHADVYITPMDNPDKSEDFGTAKYKVQLPENGDEVEVSLIDFQMNQ